LLHHPQVGAAVVEQHVRVVDHAAVDAGHRQRHADQQAQADAGEHELAPRMQDVAAGQADHGWRPASDSTTLMRLPALELLFAVHHDLVAGFQAFEHLHLAVQAALAQAHGDEMQLAALQAPDAALSPTRRIAALGSSTGAAVGGSMTA
jgi:hypothetical protein